MNKIKFGVIGTSSITDWVLAGAFMDERFSLVAVYSRTYDKGKAFADKYGVKQVFTDFDEMAKHIDAIYIASPNSCHAEQALFFMNKGIHVLCEKPLCTNLREAKMLVEASHRNNVCFMEAIIPPVNPNFVALQQNMSKIGKVRKYFSSYCQYSSRYDKYKQGIIENAFRPELSNGALVDIGVYTIYPMVVLLGRPKTVKAIGTMLESGVDASGTAVFQYEDGIEATITYSKISSSYLPTEVQGETGTLFLEKINIPRHLTFRTKSGEETDLSAQHCGNDYVYEINDFIDMIETHTIEHKVITHENSLITMEILDEIRRQIGLVFPKDLA